MSADRPLLQRAADPQREYTKVVGEGGFAASIVRRAGEFYVLQLPDGRQFRARANTLSERDATTLYLPVTKEAVERQIVAARPTAGHIGGAAASDETVRPERSRVHAVSHPAADPQAADHPMPGVEHPEGDHVVVPLAEETVEVGKRTVETGKVRIVKTVKEEQQVYDQPMFREDVEVRRVPKEEFVKHAEKPRQEGDTLVIPLYEEVLIVEKRLMLREEIYVTRRRTERVEATPVTVRREEALVEREGSADRPAGGPAAGSQSESGGVNLHD